jgi:hypothetical protein
LRHLRDLRRTFAGLKPECSRPVTAAAAFAPKIGLRTLEKRVSGRGVLAGMMVCGGSLSASAHPGSLAGSA